MKPKLAALAMLDSFVQALLWSVLCFVLIIRFELESVWYLVCSGVLVIEIGLLIIHQKHTFPGLISHLGYEPNKKLDEMSTVSWSDHLASVVIMFGVVYWGINA